MNSDTRWFTFDDPDSLFVEAEKNKFLYRIISFDTLLQMLNEKQLVLVPTERWEDKYENFILKEDFYQKGRHVPIGRLSQMLYGQCWSGKQCSDAMWRIYSPDKKGVRIRTRVSKIMEVIRQEGSCFLGKVVYLPQAKIEHDLKSLNNQITQDQLCQLMLESQFVKRNSFSHESEYRIILLDKWSPRTPDPVKKISIDPLDFIENVYFDPRADSFYVDRCKKILKEAFNYPAQRIRQSDLYAFKPMRFDIIK